MYPSVAAYARSFLERFEGNRESMYLGEKDLVRVGVGMVIDPVSLAVRLPFVHQRDGSPASVAEISAVWHAVKQSRGRRGTWTMPPADGLELVLSQTLSSALLMRRVERLLAALSYVVPEFCQIDVWPADAQLALLGMGWVLGPGFARQSRWSALRTACAALDFKAAATTCMIVEAPPSRNHTHRHLFTNAANALEGNAPVEKLFYPTILLAPIGPAAQSSRVDRARLSEALLYL